MIVPSGRTLLVFVACNTTDQCEVLEENATCAMQVCLCPSLDPLAEGTRCNSTRSLLPLALGKNCTSSADCSSTAACVAGRCRCPDGYQPSDERDCSAVRQSEFMTSWFAPMILASSIILMLLLYVCVGYRGRHSERTFWRPARPAASASTLVVSAQASLFGGDPTASTLAVPALTIESAGVVADSDRLSTGVPGTPLAAQPYEGRESWQASMMEISTQAPSVSELRGLGGTPIEPFERPVLSKEQVYAKYPHLAGLSTPTSQRSVQVAGHSETPVPEGASDEVHMLKDLLEDTAHWTKNYGSFVSSGAEPSSKFRARKCSGSGTVRQMMISPKKGDSKGPQAADAAPCEEGWPCDDSCASRQQHFGFSLPWSSMGSSLDALLSVPVVARVYECSSSRAEASFKGANELPFPVDKFRL
ncbi:uncharacterized protein [Dermacentor albipictus]|uniref:uncharacterized protein n=1 Tax=Dermacentor albipictus TaxID=60249 RepID=UPI0038FC4046